MGDNILRHLRETAMHLHRAWLAAIELESGWLERGELRAAFLRYDIGACSTLSNAAEAFPEKEESDRSRILS